MSGRYFEDLQVGAVYLHALSRTVSEYDNILFTSLTMNVQPLHLDEQFARSTEYGTRIVNSAFTLGLVMAFQVPELTLGTTLGNLGYSEITFPLPVFPGDTLHGMTTVLAKRDSTSRPDAGIVQFRHEGFNQRDELVCRCERAGLMMKKPVGA